MVWENGISYTTGDVYIWVRENNEDYNEARTEII